jgi:hypothetical protein
LAVRVQQIAIERITPPHGVRDFQRLEQIYGALQKNGWRGRPLLGYRVGREVVTLTGAHRLGAAMLSGLRVVPVALIDVKRYPREWSFRITGVHLSGRKFTDQDLLLEALLAYRMDEEAGILRADVL